MKKRPMAKKKNKKTMMIVRNGKKRMREKGEADLEDDSNRDDNKGKEE